MKVAVLYNKSITAQTVYDYINSFAQYSRHEIFLFDVVNLKKNDFTFMKSCGAIVIHYTVNIFNEYLLPLYMKIFIRSLSAVKFLIIQDEYRLIDIIHKNINFLKIDILFTCIPNNEIDNVYPSHKLPFLKEKVNVLTGYVPENLLGLYENRKSYDEREFDVVYRSRKLSAWYGRLALEKWQIVDKFLDNAKHYSLKVDLSYDESKRIYGKGWIYFLQNSKATLGVESGSSVCDFTGEIQHNVEHHEQLFPETKFEELEELYFAGKDGEIKINQISPRCFECAALGTLMILYQGNYSGILKPWRHYIPLNKDHSNVEEVICALRDRVLFEAIIDQAYKEIALNPDYSYRNLINKFDYFLDKNTTHECHEQHNMLKFEKKHSIEVEGIFSIYKLKLMGSILTLSKKILGKSFIFFLLRILKKKFKNFNYILKISNFFGFKATFFSIKNLICLFGVNIFQLKIASTYYLIFLQDDIFFRFFNCSPYKVTIHDNAITVEVSQIEHFNKRLYNRLCEIKKNSLSVDFNLLKHKGLSYTDRH